MTMVCNAKRMIKQKRKGGGGGDKSEHIYIEDKSNMAIYRCLDKN